MCGPGIGSFVFLSLSETLFAMYSWMGAVLVEAAILLNGILCAAVFRPLNLPRNTVVEEKPPKGQVTAVQRTAAVRSASTKKMHQPIPRMTDFRLFLDVVFILFAVSSLLSGIGFNVYSILWNHRISYDRDAAERHQAYWLISVVGISNIVGRLMFGYIADMKCVNRLMLYNTVLVICGICSVISVVMDNFMLLTCYSFIFGFFVGMYIFQQLDRLSIICMYMDARK